MGGGILVLIFQSIKFLTFFASGSRESKGTLTVICCFRTRAQSVVLTGLQSET